MPLQPDFYCSLADRVGHVVGTRAMDDLWLVR